jgi:hypothetical protein
VATNIEEKAEGVKEADQEQEKPLLSEADELLNAELQAAVGLREMAKRLQDEAMLLTVAAAASEKRAGLLSEWAQKMNTQQQAATGQK